MDSRLGLDSVSFETFGWPLHGEDESCRIWHNETIVLAEYFIAERPSLRSLDADELARQYLPDAPQVPKRRPFRIPNLRSVPPEGDERISRVIECAVSSNHGVPIVRVLLRLPMDDRPHGYCFIGALTIPLADCFWVVKLQADELHMTGYRETLARTSWLREHRQELSWDESTVDAIMAVDIDAPEYDTGIDEPLTAARTLLTQIEQSIRLQPEVFEQTPFHG